MRARIVKIIQRALEACLEEGALEADPEKLPDVIIEKPKKEAFGDYSTNLAMLTAPVAGKPPREIAALVAEKAGKHPMVQKCTVAGPGFINVFMKREFFLGVLEDVVTEGEAFGRSAAGGGKKVQVEFVSANPTGPLHIGHGRNAAVGDAVANLLEAAGFDVTKEYYINDVGRQMEILGRSVLLRYKELLGEQIELPEEAYRGDYIKDVARDFLAKKGERYKDAPEEEAVEVASDFAREVLLERIKKDLTDFRIDFDVWFSEKSLFDEGAVPITIDELRKKGCLYEADGALWFKTSEYGDDKDRVLIKADGQKTYFSSDVAYHRGKVERDFDRIIDVWGADHHGYEARIRALFRALGMDDSVLDVIFIQMVALSRGGEPVSMGKRAGEFVTLRQVMDEVGVDACRFFFLMRKADAHLDFDLELAKSQAPENPVYYVQYCHARIQSIFDFAEEKGFSIPEGFDSKAAERLDQKEELEIIKHLGSFGEVVERGALAMEPHKVTFYLTELAGMFHPYYNKNRVVTDDPELTRARLLLCSAVRTVAAAGLKLLGVAAPVKM